MNIGVLELLQPDQPQVVLGDLAPLGFVRPGFSLSPNITLPNASSHGNKAGS